KVVDEYEQKLAELAVCMIEDPNYRLAGAEEALRQMHKQVEQALQAHEQLANELQERASVVYNRIRALTDNSNLPEKAGTWKPPFTRRQGSGAPPVVLELLELIRSYPKTRYQSLVLQRITALYVSLRGLLSDQLREVDFCRARLGDLVAAFKDQIHAGSGRGDAPGAGRFLWADGCKSLDDAVQKLESTVGAAELVELDQRMQTLIRSQYKALVHLCMTSANVLKKLIPAMHKEARSYLRSRLGNTNVAEVFLGMYQDMPESADARLEDDLAAAYETAAPEVVASLPVAELTVLAIPAGPGEQRLRELAENAADGKPLVAAASTDEIAIYREHTLACLADLDQLGPIAQEAYNKSMTQDHFTPHSRCDITEWGTQSEEGV
ncbi:MAG TPA: hypothetical protein VE988_07985, partial [Gemmataceae bacterium]|nr:hypothetical protein [Gemmataceae bacterium]